MNMTTVRSSAQRSAVSARPFRVDLREVVIPAEFRSSDSALKRVWTFIRRHERGDFGLIPERDAKANRDAVTAGRLKVIRSEYPWLADSYGKLLVVTTDSHRTIVRLV